MLIVRSPVRISFGGGGTDLPAYYESFGGAVLSAAINKYFYTVLTKRSDEKVQVISSDLRVSETWRDLERMEVRGQSLEIPLAVMQTLGQNISADLFLASEIPPGTGLGSSASVCVNILKALTAYRQIQMSKSELAEKAFHIARNILKLPIGKQDEYAAAFGGLNFFSFRPDGRVDVEIVNLNPDLLREFQSNLLLFFTGSAHNSWSILKEQEQITRTCKSSALESLHRILELAKEMRKALINGNLSEFGRLLDDGWQAKRKISDQISNPRIDQFYALARRHGALGGKITGAGGGGFLLLYCEPDAQPAVRATLEKEGLREMNFEFDFHGAHVLVNDPFLDGDGRCGLRWTFTPHQEQCV